MEKKISYLARNYEDIKKELISFSKQYYPELSDTFNDASVGAWIIDLISAVGDDLSYHTDRMYQENNINTSNSRSTICNIARLNGIKIPGPKSSICEVELSCVVGLGTNIAQPNWNEAPIIKKGGTVGNSDYTFELTEDVNFNEQFNSDGYSNRKFTKIVDANGNITGYKITKSTIVSSGKSKIYKKVISEDELQPFMEIILPEQDILNVESILFKETSSFNVDPQTYEFYVDEEEFKIKNEAISTYRYFEVNSLSDQYRFGTKTKWDDEDTLTIDPALAEIYTENETNTARYYEGEWKPITQKFITEYTDNGYLKIIFGSATDIQEIPSGGSLYGKTMMSKIINNKMLGLLPRAGWTMFVLYRVGGGTNTNLAVGSINTVSNIEISFPKLHGQNISDVQNNVIKSLTVTNPTPSIAGKDAPSTEELKYLIKYTIPSQERCVTLKDYKSRILMIPPKYGCPFRCSTIEENNKIVISLLGLTPNKKLDSALHETLVTNLLEYLRNYKMITDYVECKSGKIYNIGISLDVFINKNYITSDVVVNIINTIKDYFDIEKHDMGEDIFVGNLEKELNSLDGVISLIDLRVYKIWGGNYSSTPCPLPYIEEGGICNNIDTTFDVENGATAQQIDLHTVDSVLYADHDSMYEILNPENDIKIRVKLK